jgi:hypothetical protein
VECFIALRLANPAKLLTKGQGEADRSANIVKRSF